jgi:hypothetical protein
MLRTPNLEEKWWRFRDLNPGPTDYDSAALTTELNRQYVLHLLFPLPAIPAKSHAVCVNRCNQTMLRVLGQITKAFTKFAMKPTTDQHYSVVQPKFTDFHPTPNA